ncbi:ATP binding [Lambiella insularis]|nr:ATP binding [Lambiella insularis]
MLAHKASFPASMGMGPTQMPSTREYTSAPPTHRTPIIASTSNGPFASPTESEFSERSEGSDSIRSWDERRVGDWLRSIKCGQYEQVFKVNNVTGSNLIECDQSVLKELGIKKIGDRVRIYVGIKALRSKAVGNHKKRNRDSIAALENRTIYTPSSSGSPKHSGASKDRVQMNKRISQFVDPSFDVYRAVNPSGKPSSPLAESANRSHRRYGGISPMENSRREQSQGYFTSSNPNSAKTVSGLRPETPVDPAISGKATGAPNRSNHSMDSTMGKLPVGQPVIRVIYNSGQTKALNIGGCKTADEIILTVLRKLGLPENHVKNYCFYVLDGVDQDPNNCRRLSDTELTRVCLDTTRFERGRLILRKIHAGEPNVEDLRKAAGISLEELHETHQTAIATNNTRNQLKIQKLTGESWDAVKYPLSPATFNAPARGPLNTSERHYDTTATTANDMDLPRRTDSRRAPKPLRQFMGARPPSELISQELSTYFPDHKRDDIERTVSMSQRRSARLSRAQSRLSIASNVSLASSLRDAPPLPSIADTWLTGTSPQPSRGPRPLSVSRFALPNPSFRDSIISTSLQPLQEESPTEPNRKSYVSFESGSDTPAVNVIDSEGQTTLQSYYGESGSSGPTTDAGDSMNEQYRHAIAEDGEEPDEELDQFLKGDSWDNVKWMQGSLIGQGSFGSVFLALHAITGELMAVKQVEMPSKSNSDIDKRKQVMVAALKREIDLLRDLQHPHIVQYLGSNCDEEHFNIFLEYVPGGSVAAMLNTYGQLKEPLIRNFVRQILDGLSYLHGQDIIHRDIKGANVLVDNKGNIKISDFGISKRVEASALLHPAKGGHIHRPSLQGSVFWMAPEVVKQTSYTRKADIWSLGCLIVEMFTGTHPFPNCSQLQAIFQIGGSGAKPTTPENASEEGKAFLKQTFEIDHEKRPSADELLLSPFLKQIA